MFTKTELLCYSCGIAFEVPSEWKGYRVSDQKTWYCPNGHPQSFTGKTDAQRLEEAKRDLAAKEAEISRFRSELYKANDDKYKLRKKLDRVKKGVCLECNRTFINLQRHMESKHSH